MNINNNRIKQILKNKQSRKGCDVRVSGTFCAKQNKLKSQGYMLVAVWIILVMNQRTYIADDPSGRSDSDWSFRAGTHAGSDPAADLLPAHTKLFVNIQ